MIRVFLVLNMYNIVYNTNSYGIVVYCTAMVLPFLLSPLVTFSIGFSVFFLSFVSGCFPKSLYIYKSRQHHLCYRALLPHLLQLQVLLPRVRQPLLVARVALEHQAPRLLDERLGGGRLLNRIGDLHDAALGARDVALDDHKPHLVVDLEHAQVLHRVALAPHAARHLLPRVDARTAALRRARRADRPVVLGVSVRRALAREPVALHAAREPHAAAVAAGVDELADLEPVRGEAHADGQQAVLGAHAELHQVPLGRDALGLVVAQHGGGLVPGAPVPAPHLHGPVPVAGARLGRHHLHLLHLQDRARRPLPLLVVHGRDALLDRQHPRPHRRRLRPALEGRRGPRRRRRQPRRHLVEPRGLPSCRGRRPPVFDAAAGGAR